MLRRSVLVKNTRARTAFHVPSCSSVRGAVVSYSLPQQSMPSLNTKWRPTCEDVRHVRQFCFVRPCAAVNKPGTTREHLTVLGFRLNPQATASHAFRKQIHLTVANCRYLQPTTQHQPCLNSAKKIDEIYCSKFQ